MMGLQLSVVGFLTLRVAILVAVALTVWACASGRKLSDGVPLEKRDWYGEFYNLKEYAKCKAQDRHPANTACEYLRLTRVEEPEYWLYPNVPKPKLPDPPNPPVYKAGMTSEQYFKALCEKEAGEFVYKTIEDVEGIYQIRPRKRASWEALMDRYVLEDPYGYTRWEAEDPDTLLVNSRSYRFLEAPPRPRRTPQDERLHPSMFASPPANARIERYSRAEDERMHKEYDADVKSKYGFLWRGIKRPSDRELSIAGGELIVVNLSTNEVLGIRRGFTRSGFVQNSRSGIQWETAEVCPRLRRAPDGWDKEPEFTRWFLEKVLKPATQKDGK